MKKRDTKELEMRLEAAAKRWKSIPPEGNEAAIEAARNEIWVLLYDLLDGEKEENFCPAVDAIDSVIKNFNPANGSIVNFARRTMKFRKLDAKTEALSDFVSLNSPINEDGTELGDIIEDKSSSEMESRAEMMFSELTAMILNFSARHNAKTGSETRRRWYRIFFTEDMTDAFKSIELRLSHERDAFEAMLLPYLDYYMTKTCRTGNEIRKTPLKPYCEVVPDRVGITEETKIPLPADVSMSYLKIVEKVEIATSNRSQQMKKYRSEIRELSIW